MDFFGCEAARETLVFGSGKLFFADVFLLCWVSSVSLSLH